MATKKRTTTPPDVAALKSVIQEQAIKIAELEKQAVTQAANQVNLENSQKSQRERADKAENTIAQAHDLMDACPSALPRTTTRKNSWGGTEDREQDLIVRMGSWLGATKAVA